ncbi:vWA domain-containing protein [Saccharospirillum impatiens]|uniref:vWA domain-containing protein n=1 Tax=Saccharospirillum impatiens TaxID=169438 RepID=UPI0004254CFB|nr:VWA domain-containing protein [Saccharospirillum impatiens]
MQTLGSPSTDTGGEAVVHRLVGFLRFLNANDFHIGVPEELDALRLARQGLLMEPRRLRWGLRALLCSGATDWRRFDDLFDAYWRKANRKVEVRASASRKIDRQSETSGSGGPGGSTPQAAEQAGEGEDNDLPGGGSKGGASRQAINATTDFRFLVHDDQQREMEQLIQRMARRMRRVQSRRQRVSRQGRRLHMRRTLRNSLKYGGMPLDLSYQQSKRMLPRMVVILDVSRSMSLYSTFFLRFARCLTGAFKQAEVFVVHTQLVHVTRALIESDSVRMREKLALMSQGWSGGTRIGDCLVEFNQRYGRRLISRRTQVMIVSDGYDTGEPGVLAQSLRQIQRRAQKVIWLNPLLGRDSYLPVATGMQAALPFLDVFAPAHNLQSLLALETELLS